MSAAACFNDGGNGYLCLVTNRWHYDGKHMQLLQYEIAVMFCFISMILMIRFIHVHLALASRMAWSPKPPSKALAKPETKPPLEWMEMVSLVHSSPVPLCSSSSTALRFRMQQAARKVVCMIAVLHVVFSPPNWKTYKTLNTYGKSGHRHGNTS